MGDNTGGNPAPRPRRAHVERGRRSRNGCSTCLSKKVKCDETRPHCGRCVRLHLICEWPLPKPSLASRRRGHGPIKARGDLWSPASIMPKNDGGTILDEVAQSLTPATQDGLFPHEIFTEHSNNHGHLPAIETSLARPDDALQMVTGGTSPGTPTSCIETAENERQVDGLLSANALLLTIPTLPSTDLSFAYATGATRALGSDDRQAVTFHCKVFAPLKSTRNWSCSAHTLFLNKAFNRNMALHFLLAVSHSELAIHYGHGPQPPQESRNHFERGFQLFLQAHNPFASPDHVSMMLSFLYMYMFWMRRDQLDPTKLRDLSRAVLVHVRNYGLDTLCASDNVLSSDGTPGVITASEQVLLARIIAYLYDRDGFCSFFGCGGEFANYMNSIPQTRQRIWLRSRAVFFLPLSDVNCTEAGSEIEDAPTLDVYFQLIILHQEINTYSQADATHAMGLKAKIQRRSEVIKEDNAKLFHSAADPKCHFQCTLMTFVTVTVYYALQIYFYRARQSLFGTRPIPSNLQDSLNALVSAAYHATKAGQVHLLERFQWSLFIAGLESTDPVHLEWIEKNVSDPAIKKGFECLQGFKRQTLNGVTMQRIRELIDGG